MATAIPNVWYPSIQNAVVGQTFYGSNIGWGCVGLVNHIVSTYYNTGGRIFSGNGCDFTLVNNPSMKAYFDDVSNDTMYPGDIVSWAGGSGVIDPQTGKDCGHVAIYAGNGQFLQQSTTSSGGTTAAAVGVNINSTPKTVLRPKKVSIGANIYGWVGSGSTYRFEYGQSYLRSSWLEVYGVWYYLKSDSYMACSEWIHINDYWYYMVSNGAMKTGWLLLDGNWYYLRPADNKGAYPEGSMVANGSWTIDGKVYNFDSKGVCLNP